MQVCIHGTQGKKIEFIFGGWRGDLACTREDLYRTLRRGKACPVIVGEIWTNISENLSSSLIQSAYAKAYLVGPLNCIKTEVSIYKNKDRKKCRLNVVDVTDFAAKCALSLHKENITQNIYQMRVNFLQNVKVDQLLGTFRRPKPQYLAN